MQYVLSRLLTQLIPTLFVASLLIFGAVRLIPGDPAVAACGEMSIGTECQEDLRRKWGLDRPFFEQYGNWVSGIFRGDFGISNKGIEVYEVVASAFPASIELTVFATIIGFGLGLLLGILAAINRGGFWDYFGSLWAGWNIGIPSFIAGFFYLIIFAVVLDVLPSFGRVPVTEDFGRALLHLLMPGLALGGIVAAQILRFTRQSMLDTLTEDFIRTARAKGLRGRVVILRHALRPSLIPVLTIMAYFFAEILGGTLIIESVFTWPGMGRALAVAVRDRDYAIIQIITMIIVTIFTSVFLLIDVIYVAIDPRIRVGRGAEG